MSQDGNKAVKGILWMFSSSAGLQAISFIVNVILARILIPADFGAVAIVLGVTGILQTFSELGTSVALVQRKEINPTIIDSAFTASLAVTLTIVTALWFLSPTVALFFNIAILEDLLKIASISYIFRGIFALYRCLLLRDMRYREISAISFFSYIIYGIVTTYLALHRYGAFSLVWGQLAWTIVMLALGIWRVNYFPASFGNIKEMKELISFGGWVSLGRVLRNSAGKFDNFIIGKLLGPSPLGAYQLAQRLVMLIPTTYTNLIDQVMLPIYSKWQDNENKIEQGYWRTLSYTSILLVPPVFLVAILAEPLVLTIFGEKWIEAIPLIKIMSLFALTRALGDGLFDSVTVATGRPKMVTLMNVFRLIVLPSCLLIGCYWGITGVAYGLGIFGICGRLFNQWLLKHFLNYSLTRYIREIFPALTFALGTSLVISFLGNTTPIFNYCTNNVSIIFTTSLIWIGCYLACVFCFAPEQSKTIIATIKSLINNKTQTR